MLERGPRLLECPLFVVLRVPRVLEREPGVRERTPAVATRLPIALDREPRMFEGELARFRNACFPLKCTLLALHPIRPRVNSTMQLLESARHGFAIACQRLVR